MPENKKELHPAVTLRLYTETKCFGPGVAMLLQRVKTLHSLRSAAMHMNMAYSKAWTILKEAEKGLGFKLLHSTTGGKGGGGATLTERGEQLLNAYETCERELKAQSQRLFDQYLAPITTASPPDPPGEL